MTTCPKTVAESALSPPKPVAESLEDAHFTACEVAHIFREQQLRHEHAVHQMLAEHREYLAQLIMQSLLTSTCHAADQIDAQSKMLEQEMLELKEPNQHLNDTQAEEVEDRGRTSRSNFSNGNEKLLRQSRREQESRMMQDKFLRATVRPLRSANAMSRMTARRKPSDENGVAGGGTTAKRYTQITSEERFCRRIADYHMEASPYRVSVEERTIKDQLDRLRGKKVQEPNCWLRLLNNRRVECVICGMLTTNALLIGINADIQIRSGAARRSPPYIFRVLDVCFTIGFLIELILRIFGEKRSFISVMNQNFSWNVFDSFIVSSALVEELILLFTASSVDLSTLRILRILRLIRIIRVIRVMRFFRELRLMINCISDSMKTLVWAACLLSLIIYIFAVCVLQIAVDFSDGSGESREVMHKYFGSLLRAMHTLYLSITGGIDWNDASEALEEIHPALAFFFVVYIGFAVFVVLNIVTSVFVDKGMKLAMEDDNQITAAHLENRLNMLQDMRKLFDSVDHDGDGELAWEEFERMFNDVRLLTHLRHLGMKTDSDSARAYFMLFDFQGRGTITLDSFVRGIENYNGNARSLDVYRLLEEQRSTKDVINHLVCELDDMRLYSDE